ARERHRQVEAQAEVDEVERLFGTVQILTREAALEHPEGELLVVAAEARVQTRRVLHDGGLDLVEAVRTVGVLDDGEDALAPRLLGREEVPHAAGRVHLTCHPSILSAPRGGGERRMLAIIRARDAAA